jgi:hypothetical protein
MRLQRRKRKTPQHNTKKKKKKKVKKTVSPPHPPLSVLSHHSLSQLFLTTRACSCCCCCWAQCTVPCEQELYPPRSVPHSRTWISLSLCPDSRFLLPMKRLGGLLGKTNSSYRATQFNWPPSFVKKLLRNNSSRICASRTTQSSPPSLPRSDRPACLPACLQRTTIASAAWRKEGRKEGSMDGWMDGWMDENWVLSVAHFFYYLPN